MTDMQQLFTVSPSPHVHTGRTTRSIMADVVIALMPMVILSCLFYGWREVHVLLCSVGSCVLLEYLITRFLMHRPNTVGDLSAVVTGILLAMNLPSDIPLWIVLVGAIIAIGVAKMSFGGLGQNIFNPAIVARVFLLVSFPVQMTSWQAPSIVQSWTSGVDAVTGPTLLSLLNEGIPFSEINPEMIVGGSAGEISFVATLLGFMYLLIRKVVRPWIPIAICATVYVFAGILHLCSPLVYPPAYIALASGGLLLGACFMATDYVTSPMTDKGGIVFGIGIGILTVVIRYWGAYPEGVSFAILIMNACVPLINKLCPSGKFGRK